MKKKLNQKKSKLELGLIKGLKEAVAHEQGQINLKTSQVKIPENPPIFNKEKVKAVREQLNVSQPIFAKILGVSDDTVKAWERGANTPSGSSARLIQIADKDPKVFQEIMQSLTK